MLERWDPPRHLPLLTKWGKERGIFVSAGPANFYPKNGYVADGKMIGFLFLTDAPRVAYMDMFVSSPDSTKEERANMVTEIVNQLSKDAGELGVRVIMGATANESFRHTLEKTGFAVHGTGYAYLYKTITES